MMICSKSLLSSHLMGTRQLTNNRSLQQCSRTSEAIALGIMREKHNMWERRAPLSPRQIKQLLSQDPNLKVLVQPCFKRVFADREYVDAGATLTEDLSEASLIIGVKAPELTDLIDNRTYAFFSHVIKAQPKSMPLLDAVLKKNIRLFDYECITEEGRDDAKRTVTFGYFAGQAGMIDGLQGLGLRLLAEGYSTPLLNIASAYMHATIKEALDVMDKVAVRIADCTNGIVPMHPIVVAFTGSGNVTQGARSVFERLPHEYVQVCDLPSLRRDVQEGRKSANKLYGVLVKTEDIVRSLVTDVDSAGEVAGRTPFDKHHYYRRPHEYEPVFHLSVAPYVTMLINGIYWDKRFHRLLSNDQLRNLFQRGLGGSGGHCGGLKVVADITCDIDGSVECLSRASSIEDPFYTYDPLAGTIINGIHKEGVVMLGVDNLPSELPRDASEYFGHALLPLIPQLLQCATQLHPIDDDGDDGSDNDSRFIEELSPVLRRACIAADGKLTPRWSVIDRLRHKYDPPTLPSSSMHKEEGSISTPMQSITVELVGHLFDSGVINKVLDIFDTESTIIFSIEDISVNTKISQHSRLLLCIRGPHSEGLQRVTDSIAVLMSSWPGAEGTIHVKKDIQSISIFPTKRVLLLGSGRVAKPVVRLFNKAIDMNIALTIAADDEFQGLELVALAEGRATAKYVKYKYPGDNVAGGLLSQLIRDCDLVLSLLPATMHIPIAEEAIRQGKHLVTASYVSKDMQLLDAAAREKGVVLLNEAGLDPGIDHMLIMKAVNDIHNRGGVVTNLVSLCGGLPDPIAANNPFRYKFSWSPRGVLSAATNAAQYLDHGHLVKVSGELLLRHGRASSRFPTLRLETLPNRDSLQYRELYGVLHVHSICRGTLRYEGWSNIMHAMKMLGLLDSTETTSISYPHHHHDDHHNGGESIDDMLRAHRRYLQSRIASMIGRSINRPHVIAFFESLDDEYKVQQMDEVLQAMDYIGLLDEDDANPCTVDDHSNMDHLTTTTTTTCMDSLCLLLEHRLRYCEGERDMVAMVHEVTGCFPTGVMEKHTSRLLAFGSSQSDGDTAMSETVGYTAAAAAELVLSLSHHHHGSMMPATMTGVQIPTSKVFYEPILSRLQHFDIAWAEAVEYTSTAQ